MATIKKNFHCCRSTKQNSKMFKFNFLFWKCPEIESRSKEEKKQRETACLCDSKGTKEDQPLLNCVRGAGEARECAHEQGLSALARHSLVPPGCDSGKARSHRQKRCAEDRHV